MTSFIQTIKHCNYIILDIFNELNFLTYYKCYEKDLVVNSDQTVIQYSSLSMVFAGYVGPKK